MLDNFFTTPDDAKTAYLENLVQDDLAAQEQIVTYREFYAGDQSTELTDRMEEFLGINAGKNFRLNQCPVVVESLVERLGVSGFEEIGADEPAEETPAAAQAAGFVEFAQTLWEQNRLDAGQEQLYRQAAIDSAAYIVLDIDPMSGQITLNINDAYTALGAGGDDDGVKLHYANAKRRGQPVYATKRYSAVDLKGDATRHLIVYYPDRIERFVSDKKATEKYSEALWRPEIAESGPLAGVWPQPWTDAAGQPLGLPVVEFANGQGSELAEVIPIQKALNKSYIDLIAGADLAGFGLLFAAGWVPTSDGKPLTQDSNGKVTSTNTPLSLEQGAILFSTNPDARLERVPGDDLDKLIRVVDSHAARIAQVSRTPITNFQLFGQIPAENTQKQVESGLVAKAESRQRVYGNAWEDVFYLARRMALGAPVYANGQVAGYGLEAYSGYALDTTARLSALWNDPHSRNEKETLETLQIKRDLGVPEEQLFLEMGYTVEQAEKFAGEAEARRLAGVALQMEQARAAQPQEQEETGGGPESTATETT